MLIYLNSDTPEVDFIKPDTFNEDNNVVSPFNNVVPDTFNELLTLVLLLFIIILDISLTLKFIFPVPLEFTFTGLLGIEISNEGINF